MSSQKSTRAKAASAAEPVALAAWFTLAILVSYYLMSVVDKQMIALLVNPLGQSMELDDSQLGLVMGVAFGIFYTASVFGAGWLLDRYSKKVILFFAVFAWSLAAMATGLVDNFEQLFVARALIGIGEGFLPSAGLAIIASIFPKHRVAMATSIFFSGASLGSVTALGLGGAGIAWLNERGGIYLPLLGQMEAWRAAFVLSALPGIFLAFFAFMIKTGERSREERAPVSPSAAGGKSEFLGYIRRHASFMFLHNMAFGLQAAAAYALMMWSPAHLERTYGWAPDRIGYILAIGSLLGAGGNIFWGTMADRVMSRTRYENIYLLYACVYVVGIVAVGLAFTLASSAVFAPIYFVASATVLATGGIAAAIQLGTPSGIRARVMGLQILTSGLFGIGIAPTLVPAISQYIFQDRNSIGLSIFMVVFLSLVATIAMILSARRPMARAVAEVEMGEPVRAGDPANELPATA